MLSFWRSVIVLRSMIPKLTHKKNLLNATKRSYQLQFLKNMQTVNCSLNGIPQWGSLHWIGLRQIRTLLSYPQEQTLFLITTTRIWIRTDQAETASNMYRCLQKTETFYLSSNRKKKFLSIKFSPQRMTIIQEKWNRSLIRKLCK